MFVHSRYKMGRVSIILFITMVTMYGMTLSDPFIQRLARRARKPTIPLPPDVDLERFVQTCELCGMFHTGAITYRCLTDSSHATFQGCQIAIGQ